MDHLAQPLYRAIILGGIWWPMGALCSTERTYRAEDDGQAVELAHTMTSDFSSIQDVQVMRYADPYLHRYPTIMVKDWDTEENEADYWSTVAETDAGGDD